MEVLAGVRNQNSGSTWRFLGYSNGLPIKQRVTASGKTQTVKVVNGVHVTIHKW